MAIRRDKVIYLGPGNLTDITIRKGYHYGSDKAEVTVKAWSFTGTAEECRAFLAQLSEASYFAQLFEEGHDEAAVEQARARGFAVME